jgi:hypothetical protein
MCITESCTNVKCSTLNVEHGYVRKWYILEIFDSQKSTYDVGFIVAKLFVTEWRTPARLSDSRAVVERACIILDNHYNINDE